MAVSSVCGCIYSYLQLEASHHQPRPQGISSSWKVKETCPPSCLSLVQLPAPPSPFSPTAERVFWSGALSPCSILRILQNASTFSMGAFSHRCQRGACCPATDRSLWGKLPAEVYERLFHTPGEEMGLIERSPPNDLIRRRNKADHLYLAAGGRLSSFLRPCWKDIGCCPAALGGVDLANTAGRHTHTPNRAWVSARRWRRHPQPPGC